MLKIGLTGGIGSGKSTVAKCFAKFKIPVIDADTIVHELLKPNTSTYKKIVTHFGEAFLTPKKFLNRKKLRETIFADSKEKNWLEKLLHPKTRVEIRRRTAKIQAPYCILAIPLLLETKFPIKVDRILVIDCPKSTQIKRVRSRSDLPVKQIQAIISSQIDRKSRLQQANDIIYNNSSLQNMRKSVKKLHNYYLSLI